jgi:hypothetical protein
MIMIGLTRSRVLSTRVMDMRKGENIQTHTVDALTETRAQNPANDAEQSAMQRRLARNVFANWTWYTVVLASGFLV